MIVRYDGTVDALYLKLRGDEAVSRTEQIDRGTLVDLDRFGRVLGIEVLRPARPWPLQQIIEEFKVSPEDAAQLRALSDPNGRFPYGKAAELVAG